MVRPIEKLSQNLFICASALAQHAALASFEPQTIAIYEARRLEF
jgi:aspartate/methionine/tyrosine aminotransferase